jgi:hypothetical protein
MSAKKQPLEDLHIISTLGIHPTLATTITTTGILLTALAYTVLSSTPLTALGISTVIIGAVTYAITKGQPKIPPQASALLLQAGIENTSALVEEIGLKNKAIYLPTSKTGDKPKALIPLELPVELDKKTLPNRLIIKYGPKPTDMGLLIITPGSSIQGMVEAKQDCTASDLEAAITQVLVKILCLVDGLSLTFEDENLMVEVNNPRLENPKMWIFEIIGTPIASIIASITAEVLNKPVIINAESNTPPTCSVQLKILERET